MEREQLLDRLAGAVLDSEDVDWADAESTADDIARPFVRHLRLVASVGQLHRSLQPTEPATWGHLRLIERIGRGTFGEVFRAWDPRLDREVALKLIPARQSITTSGESLFIQEGRMLARVRHPNVVTIYGAEQIGDRIGLWMEFVRGRTLEQLLKAGTVFRPADVVRIGVELSRAVSAVHSAGLLHRDIKTHNVIRDDDGRIVLMDFGAGTERDTGPSPGLAGTPLYLAPELYAGGTGTVQSDIYSLGVLLFRLVTKSYPVKGRTLEEVRRAHERGERIDIRSRATHVRRPLIRVIERACDPQVKRRYQTADALVRDLSALQPRSVAVRARNSVAAAVAVATLVLMGSEAAARLTGNHRLSLANRLGSMLTRVGSPLERPIIVVRPFENLGNTADKNLADLITDSLIRRLGLVEGLQVRGLDTSFRLADAPRDLAATGKQLGVNLVLEGNVRFSNEKLVLNAALITVSGERLWGEPFERPLGSESDIAAMVEELARGIVNRLRLQLGPTRMQYPTDVTTLRTILEARRIRQARGVRGFDALSLYATVIDTYPDHAPVLADMAAIYGDLGAQYPTAGKGSLVPREAQAMLLPLAQRALDLDDFLAEAHAAMGFFHGLALRWDDARESFLRAIALEPTRSTLRGDYVLTVLVPTGRLDEAIEFLEDALVDDPESLDLRRILARVQLNAGRFGEALKNARLVLEQDPSFPFVETFATWAQLFLDQRVEAIQWFEKSSFGNDGIEGTADDLPRYKGYIYAINGQRAEAEKIAALPLFKRLPLGRVEIFGLLGDAEQALEALEDQAKLNPLRAAFYLTYPELHFMRDDPRLAAFRRRLGIP